jgi:hypothetical protein
MIQKVWERWNLFWFSPVPLLNLAIFRIIFCFTMAGMYLARQKDVNFYFTDQGILPKHFSLQILPPGFRPPFIMSFWPDSFVPAVHGLFVVLLILIGLGFFSRLLSWFALYLQLAFMFRNYGVAFGADQIGSIFLMYLAWTKSDARLSIRSWLRTKAGQLPVQGDLLTSIFYRMVQIQLCIIYVYSGMEKLKGSSWWDGTAVWSVLANSQMVIADLTWTRHVPLLIVAASFTTILFEVYFPVLVWMKPLRKYFLIAGVCFHAGIGTIMALWSFALIMVSPYILFLSEIELEQALAFLRLKLRRTEISRPLS